VIVTDTVPAKEGEDKSAKIIRLSTSSLIGEAIKRM
jgi:phosphoribosylpyrophosphate synthetase